MSSSNKVNNDSKKKKKEEEKKTRKKEKRQKDFSGEHESRLSLRLGTPMAFRLSRRLGRGRLRLKPIPPGLASKEISTIHSSCSMNRIGSIQVAFQLD